MSMENSTERLKLFGLEGRPHFVDTKRKDLNGMDLTGMRNFVIRDEKHESASVNVFKVVGTKHPNYAGKSWLNLLLKGKRMEHNLKRFIENSGYREDASRSRTWTMSPSSGTLSTSARRATIAPALSGSSFTPKGSPPSTE